MDLEKMKESLKRVNIKIMADELEISTVALYGIRDGKHIPRLDTAMKIAGYLKKLSEGCGI